MTSRLKIDCSNPRKSYFAKISSDCAKKVKKYEVAKFGKHMLCSFRLAANILVVYDKNPIPPLPEGNRAKKGTIFINGGHLTLFYMGSFR